MSAQNETGPAAETPKSFIWFGIGTFVVSCGLLLATHMTDPNKPSNGSDTTVEAVAN